MVAVVVGVAVAVVVAVGVAVAVVVAVGVGVAVVVVTRADRWLACTLTAAVVASLVWFPTTERVECLRTGPWGLKAYTVAGEAGIATAYAWIPVRLVLMWLRLRVRPVAVLLVLFGAFIVFCGLTHALAIYVLWDPVYWLAAKLKAVTAAVSLTVAYVTDRNQGKIVELGETGARLAAKGEEVESQNRELSSKNAQLEESLRVLEDQRRTIRNLSVPLLRVGSSSLLLPLVGVLDSERASSVRVALLAQIAVGNADQTILDLTGVEFVDSAVARHVLDLVRAVNLMGGSVIVTGIQPEVSQTMVSLGVDLGVETYRTIEQGLARLASRGAPGAPHASRATRGPSDTGEAQQGPPGSRRGANPSSR